MSLDSPEHVSFLRLLAAAFVVGARSYHYRWSSSDDPSLVVVQIIDVRQYDHPIELFYELSISPTHSISQLLDAVRLVGASSIDVPTTDISAFLFNSDSAVEQYFGSRSESLSSPPSRSVIAAVSSDTNTDAKFLPLPDPYESDPWLPHRLSSAFSTISSPQSPTLSLRSVPVVSDAEKHALLSLNEHSIPSEVTYPCIHHYFEDVARTAPDTPALCFDGPTAPVTVTYGEMDRRCGALAAYLISAYGAGPGMNVPVFFTRGIEMFIGIFAVLKTGASYVPLDPDHPAERTAFIVSAAGTSFVLAQSNLVENVRARLDESISVIDSGSVHPLDVPEGGTIHSRGSGDDLAYIIFTSGTTGVPKGVPIHHRAIVQSIVDGPPTNRAFRKSDNFRMFLSANYAFDFSVWDIFMPLASGGCLCIATKEATMDDISGVLRRLSVNVVMTTPTVIALIEPSEVPTLDTVASGGEMLPPTVRDRFMQAGVTFGNIYGPTEAAVACTYQVQEDTSADPTVIGKPFGCNRIYVLDEEENLLPHGAVGSLWIAGLQVSRGYLGRPELTAALFRPDPFARGDDVGQMMYNSGDLAAWNEDGYLKCYGRADEQMKIRGQRVEILEIEAVIGRVPDVFAACVVKRVKDEREDLVAFYSLEASSSADVATVEKEIVETSLRLLPVYMRPSAFIHMEKLPMTINGKADRRQLRQRAAELKSVFPIISDGAPAESRTETESLVAQCWSTILSIPADSIPLLRDFYECGGDSVSMIRLAAMLRKQGLPMKTSDLRAATTIAAQAALILERGVCTKEGAEEKYQRFSLISPTVVSLDTVAELMGCTKDVIEDVYPCSSTVVGLVSLAASNSQSYYAQHAFKRSGHYDVDHLRAAWKAVIRRHAILRTAFIIPPLPATDILQVVLEADAYELHFTHDRVVDKADLDRSVADYLEMSRQSGFLMGIVPTRVALFEGPSSSVMVFQIHHSQYDGWSLPFILNDVQEAYESLQRSSPLQITGPSLPYSEFIRWTRQQSAAAALTFWTSELEDAALLSWPKVPHDSNDIATDTLITSTWTPSGDLAKFCGERKVTASSLLRLALAIVLGLHSNSDDVLFGVVTSGRSGDLPGVENVVGPCIATLPFRVRLPSDASLESILATVQDRSSAAAAYEYVGLADIIKAGPFSRSRNIFQVLLTVENIPELDFQAHPLFGEDVHGHQMEMNYALGVTVFLLPQNEGFKIDIEYDSRHLTGKDVHWFTTHLRATLDAILDAPSTAVGELDIVTAEERAFLREVGIGLTPDPVLAAEPFVHRLIEKTALAHPYRIAIEHTSGQRFTYAELEALSNRTARGLRARGVSLETPIPVLFNKDADQTEAVIAIVALMKSGGAFVPLDVSWPLARLNSCVRQCDAPFVVCDSDVPDVVHGLSVPFVTVAELARAQSPEPFVNEEQTPSSLAYVIFTSGSTGEPKGVMIEHRNIMGYVANGTTVYPIKDVKRLLHFSPFSFDQGLGDIFMALTKGATLVLANMSDVLTDLSEVLNSTQVDYTVLTPAIAQLIRNDVEHPYLKSLLVGGEKLPGQLVDRWKGQVAFMDDYGPTEVTVSCAGMTFTDTTQVPAGVIGRSYGDTRAYIVDAHNVRQLLPVGAVGELCLSGNQVGRGYLKRPDLTAAAFVPDPFAPGLTMYRSGDRARWTSDGYIEYLGRQDDAFVKLRGLRIDTGEIEDAITGAGETFAVVELLELRGQPHLVAFVSRVLASAGDAALALVEPADDSEADARALRAWLADAVQACREAVPVYAVPTVWLALRAMPQNTNSKFDRKQLRAFYAGLAPAAVEAFSAGVTQRRAPRAPESALERAVARVWGDVLGREAGAILSVYDDFFSLGGDSIAVVRMLAALKTLGLVISLKEFAAGPTVAELAAYFGSGSSAGSSSPAIVESVLPRAGNGLVWQVQTREGVRKTVPLWMIHDGGGLGNEYKNMTALERDVHAVSNPSTSINELRTQFPSMESYISAYEPLIPADDDVFLGGWSVGGYISLAIAARRLSAGQRVRGIVLIDTFNMEGWRYKGSPAASDSDEKLSTEEFVRAHQAHIDNIVGQLALKRCDIPVLLVRAGITADIEKEGFAMPYLRPGAGQSVDSGIAGLESRDGSMEDLGDTKNPMERNFWTKSVVPRLEVVTIEGANHYSLMRDGELCARASKEVAGWLARLDS